MQRKNVVRYTFYNEKMLNATLFTTKKCDEVEYSGISDNFFRYKARGKRAVFDGGLIDYFFEFKVD